MQFKTTIDISHAPFELSHKQKGMSIGSCFSTNIGNYLLKSKFSILVNPLGTIYNPTSIANAIDLLFGLRNFGEENIFFAHGIWQSYDLHTLFSSISKENVLRKFLSIKEEFQTRFSTLDYVIITLGTSWIYELNETKQIVNNCHKMPSSQFCRRRLSVDECVSVLKHTIEILRRNNSNIQVIFTISPVRHWKDGAHENQVSKSTLFLAIEELQNAMCNISYFPAYELLMDDLRDYRFYADDMLHPSEMAIEYIWKHFSGTYFSKKTMEIVQTIDLIHKAIEHRPFNEKNKDYVNFLRTTLQKCEIFEKEHAYVYLAEEKRVLTSKLLELSVFDN